MHTVALDGVFSVVGPTPVFHQLRGPTDDEVADIVATVASDVIEALRRRGYLPAEGAEVETEARSPSWLEHAFADSEQLAAAAEASSRMHLAFGVRAGQKVRRIGRGFGLEDELPLVKGRRCSSANGFTVHANRYVGAQERRKLEYLLAYGARGAFSHERLSLADPASPEGDLVYTLKRRWTDGTTAIVLSASEMIEKLVALIPPPYVHLSRYFGVLSSHSKWRSKIVLKPEVKKGFVATPSGPARMTWSRLLARVFKIDLTRCGGCGAKIYPEQCEIVTATPLVAAILHALGLDVDPPVRGPPRRACADQDIDQRPP